MTWITSSFRNGYRGQTTSARRSGRKPKPCSRGTRRRQHRWLPLKRPWVKIASARIVARQAPYRVARQGVCDGTSAKNAGRHSMPRPAPPCRVCTTRTSGFPSEPLADGLTVRASAERCGLAVNTAFRRRHRFPAAKDLKARKLTGIVEADETYMPESRKGARNLERKARRRGARPASGACQMNRFRYWVLVVADRGGATVSAVLPAVNADTLREVIAPVVDEDIVLVTDGIPRLSAMRGGNRCASRSIEPVTK